MGWSSRASGGRSGRGGGSCAGAIVDGLVGLVAGLKGLSSLQGWGIVIAVVVVGSIATGHDGCFRFYVMRK